VTLSYTLDLPGMLVLLVQVVLPLLVGLVTRASTPPGVQAVLLLALTAATQFFSEWSRVLSSDEMFDWRVVLLGSVVWFVVSVGMHYGLWKPTKVTDQMIKTGVRDPLPRE